jgi:serine/threonine protein kinase
LDSTVELERLLFSDGVAERYAGALTSSGEKVRVLVFNQRFAPEVDRVDLVKATNALISEPIPTPIASLRAWKLDHEPAYMIESLAPGVTLRQLIAERDGLDWPLAVRITCHLARSLEWLEQLGVIHRALSTGAITVTNIQTGQIQLAEWGLGVLTHHPDPMAQAQAGAFVPYPEYMPPEKISDKGRSDKKSLVYQMGLLLYEMIAAKAAFSGASDVELLKRHLHETPAKLSVLRGAAGLPEALEDLLTMMLDRAPEKRFQMPGAAVNALSSQLSDASSADFPVISRPDAAAAPAPAPSSQKAAEKPDSKKTLMFTAVPDLKPLAKAAEEPAATMMMGAVKGESKVDDAAKPTELMDGRVLEQDKPKAKADDERRAPVIKAGDPPPVFDPESNKADGDGLVEGTVVISKDFSDANAPNKSSGVSGGSSTSEDSAQSRSAGGISGSSVTAEQKPSVEEPADKGEKKKKKKTSKQKAISGNQSTAASAAVAAAPEPSKADADAKRAEQEAKQKAEEAEAKRKAEEAEAKRKADEQRVAEEAARLKEEQESKKRLDEAKQKAEAEKPELKQSSATPRKTMGMRALGASDAEADAWFIEDAESAWEQAEVRDIVEVSEKKNKNLLIGIGVVLIVVFIIFVVVIQNVKFKKADEEGNEESRRAVPTATFIG